MSDYCIVNQKDFPELYIDGTPVAPVVYALSDFPGAKSNTVYAQKNIKAFGEEGVNIVALDTELRFGWRKGVPFEPALLIAEITDALEANPNARFLIRLHVNPPYWWLKDHPDQCVIYRTEEGDMEGIDRGEDYVRLIRTDNHKEYRASVASKVFLKETCENIKAFLKALEDTPEGEALLGIQPAYGVNGEWHPFGCDVSQPMKDYFRDYLKETYQTEEKLQAAWNDREVTFETAQLHPEVFAPGEDYSMRDSRYSQRITDSQRALQKATAEAIIAFCRAGKAAAPHILCGSFYGYYLGLNGITMPMNGHLGMDLIYSARDAIDFLAGPSAYAENRKSNGVPMQRTFLESHRLNGLLWLTEMDQAPVGTERFVGGDPEKYNETLSVLRRNTLIPLLGGEGFWFYDHRLVPNTTVDGKINTYASSIYHKKGWWDNPDLMNEIGKLRSFAEKVRKRAYSKQADTLIVYDTDSFYYRATACDGGYRILEPLSRAGISYDQIYLQDLDKCRMESYRCVIFTNCFALTECQRAEIRKLTAGKTVVYMNCTGYSDKNSLSEENVTAAVGMRLKRREAEKIRLPDGTEWDIPEEMLPVFEVVEDGADVWARFEDGGVAAACKGSTVYIATTFLTKEFAERIRETANLHRWCDSDDPVFTGFGYALINCHKAGERNLLLPNGEKIPVKTDDFATYVYDIESGERVI